MRLLGAAVFVLALGCDSGSPDSSPDAAAESPDGASARVDAAPVAGCDLDPSIAFNDIGETLQLATADGTSCALFLRRNDCGKGFICKAIPFTILEARIAHGDQVYVKTDSTATHWEGTHHNWTDWADVRVDDTCLHLQLIFGDPFKYDVDARNCDTAAALWSTQLLPYPAK
jgi:hypothetical protein